MNFIIRIANYAILIGLILTANELWGFFKERNVNQTPIEVKIDDVENLKDELVYVSIDGGDLDIRNTYEYFVRTERSNIDLSITYYTPVLETENRSVAYILKDGREPTAEDWIETAKYQGLLQNKKSQPESILTVYETKFPNQEYFYLDTSYEPKTFFAKIQDMSTFLFLLFGGLFGRIFLTRATRQ